MSSLPLLFFPDRVADHGLQVFGLTPSHITQINFMVKSEV